MNTAFLELAAAQREVNLLCEENTHLVEDELVSQAVMRAANGRKPYEADYDFHGYFGMRPRILPAEPDAPARYTGQHATELVFECSRCGDDFNESIDGQYAERRCVWIPAGPAIVELVICRGCLDYLVANYGPFVWI